MIMDTHQKKHRTDERAKFLPVCRADMEARGWKELDILLVCGDAYVDHPSFGIPLLGRVLEAAGYKVGIVSQPRWDTKEDIMVMGRPRLFCGIGAGCLDSMLAHYTAFRKKRHDDAYTPGGKAGARPNRACIVYTGLVRSAFPGLFTAIGGIEASLRRAAHYDFWTDSLRRSILLDSKADLLIYGMGERQLLELASRLDRHKSTLGIPGTAWVSDSAEGAELLPSYEDILLDKANLMKATLAMEQHVHNGTANLAQAHGNRFVTIAPPQPTMTTEEMDAIYALPFTRQAHPSYKEHIPAIDTVKWSMTAVRGCGGGCAFCSIALHQGRHLSSRSRESLQNETRKLTAMRDWKGTISDVGGPTANLWGAYCKTDAKGCRRSSCLAPQICPNLVLNQVEYLKMLRSLKRIDGVRNVGIASGIRHDAALKEPEFIDILAGEFTSGHLKLAPEHISPRVLRIIRKPDFSLFERFCQLFAQASKRHGKEQYIVPYIMSALPGCEMEDMRKISQWFHRQGWQPQQCQCFIPTPGTVATAMFYAGIDTGFKPIHIPGSDREREDQHKMIFRDSRETSRDSRGKTSNQNRRHHSRNYGN